NVEAVVSGQLDSGFSQSDVAYWAYTGTGIYEGKEPLSDLRAIAGLYPESLHLVVRRGAGIERVQDLLGKRVSLDEEGSGTLVNARIILDAFGISENDIEARFIKPNFAISEMREGRLDAFIVTVGYPAKSVSELAMSETIDLLPIQGDEVDTLLETYDFFANDVIPEGVYPGIGQTKTLSVGAQWITSAALDETLVYAMTEALWHDSARALLDEGHAKARSITLDTALDGIAIPLHPGAERFYRDAGIRKGS
ncbi:MAG: TAXI family TRAP transporter solute-binding subunit, partial [Pseudomonadota bacterium]